MKRTISLILYRIDGKGYKHYRKLLGAQEEINDTIIRIIRVQGDPFAPPSVVGLEAVNVFPNWSNRYPVALGDWVYRRLYSLLKRYSGRRGEGRSGFLGLPKPSPVMLKRSGVEVLGDRVIARVWIGLPSKRRRILGEVARELLLEILPRVFRRALEWERDERRLREHISVWRLQEYLRSRLPSMGLVSFIGDGSILPRKCGGCDEPLPGAVPFESPRSLRVEIEVPWLSENIVGMGVRRGVTVVMGSAFHGKSTLLEAIAAGVWNHIPGDGRERVVTIREAMYVRAEDGRFISCVDVSSFIHNLPGGRDTKCFSTSDASGATSTAASIQEAVEAGAKLLLLDEDTVATNILYSDERVEELVEWKTITPITKLARDMVKRNLSLIIVSSGSQPLIAVADTIILMEAYKPRDITLEAKKTLNETSKTGGRGEYRKPPPRIIIEPPVLRKPRIRGRMLVDKSLEAPIPINNIHLVEEAQYNTIALILSTARRFFRSKSIASACRRIEETLRRGEYESLLGREPGPGLSEVRSLDIAYVVNRLPGLRVAQEDRVH